MFLAIINDTYGDVKSDKSKGEDEFRISDYLLRVGMGGVGWVLVSIYFN